MAPLFSKVDLNKLWHDVQNEENVIYVKFGKDLFNISKVIGRKKVAQFFLTHSVLSLYCTHCIGQQLVLNLALLSCSLCYVKLYVIHVLLFEQIKKGRKDRNF